MRVFGAIEPSGGIVSATDPIRIESTSDSIEIKAGASRILIYASGAIKILAADGNDITIDAGTGDLIMKGASIEIASTFNLDIDAGLGLDINADGTMDLNATQIHINGSTSRLAKEGSIVSVAGPTGVITANLSNSVFTQ